MVGMDWKPEHDAALKECRANRFSFRDVSRHINEKFGTSYSRNACIGRAKRLGMTCEIRGLARSRAAERKDVIKPQIALRDLPAIPRTRIRPDVTMNARAKHPGNLEIDERPLRCVEIDPKRLSIQQLSAETCRWPYGGWPSAAPITFCGHWCPKDVPYCDAHQALAAGSGTRTEQLAHLAPRERAP